MGIETILVVGFLIIIVSLAIGLGRARRRARAAQGRDPETGAPAARRDAHPRTPA
jgi:hypothetical protein